MPVPALASSIRDHLQRFDFKALFIEDLGWEHCPIAPFTVSAGEQAYTLRPVAQKRGPAVLLCDPDSAGGIPDYATRRKIAEQARRTIHEHVIIYVDRDPTAQCWQWVRRQPGRPAAFREYRYYKGQSGETLVQRLQQLMVDLTDEENTSLVDVLHKMSAGFDAERVTKKFYDRFKTEHAAFLSAIQGIASTPDAEWYASLMLNRLMFTYFIQRQGFLDGDHVYLRNRLASVRLRVGPDQFHSFYRSFLLRLFHDGFGKVASDRSPEVVALIGAIPYLNGGLFEMHAIEKTNEHITIVDEAFTRVFAFFEDYTWHLDTEHVDEKHSDKEINPDVLGYIFEKHINQKQMGAYYTKEDITGYISRNTVIPYLFDAARAECRIAFEPGGEVWRLLRDDPDRYIYEAVRRGVDLPLPAEIAAGLEDVSRRGGWNRAIGDNVNYLPTETWREFVARRARCLDLRAKLAAGEISEINDLITYNLDIVRFAHDVIERAEGPELVRAFWHALSNVTVLDPTCGSGAFL
ncbi:MAG: Eco57I restriction-modification methylase domain-containing protein, partial [Ktedonobacterales bacterium]